VLAAVVLAWSIHGAKIRPGELLDGIPQIFLTLGRMFPPDFSKITESKNYFLPETLSWRDLLLPLPTAGEQARARQRWWDNTFPQTVIGATLETVQMALAGTFLALLVAFPLGFLAARNTTPHRFVYYGVRSCLNLVRTIPDLALGLLFVAAVGLGAFAGTLALAVHTATVLGKLLSESVENIDEGVVEAIRATGAGYAQILSFAVLPQILPDLISFTLYRLETNIRAASVLGLIGAGGIGYLMNTSFRTFQYQEAAAIVLVLIALVMLVDYLSSRLRARVV
jgi:phosphonate transport system permease protein